MLLFALCTAFSLYCALSNFSIQNGNGNQDDFADARSRDGYSQNQHHGYPPHLMQQGHPHPHLGYSMGPNGQQTVGYYGMPNAAPAHGMTGNGSHMSGHYPGTMYSYPPYMGGAVGGAPGAIGPDALYRGSYYTYPPYGPPPDVYGYSMQGAPNRAQSVGAGETESNKANGSNGSGSFALPIGGPRGQHQYGSGNSPAYTASLGLSASPPSEHGWNKSSPRGGKRGKTGAKGEPSLSSSTEDLLSLVGKPHLIKEYGTPGSNEFSGSLSELPAIGSGGPSSGAPGNSPSSPRSPQHARKPIKVQQRGNNNGNNGRSGHPSNSSSAGHLPHGADSTANGSSNDLRSSHPMPIGWGSSGAGGANSDDFSGLIGGIHINAPGQHALQQQEFVMGSGSPILARMHHPGMTNGSAAPGSGSSLAIGASSDRSSNGPICHYYPLGLCGKGDKCRYAHVDDPTESSNSGNSSTSSGRNSSSGGNSRRTPRAPTQVISFGPDNSGSNASNMQHMHSAHHQQVSPTMVHPSSIGQAPLLGSMNGSPHMSHHALAMTSSGQQLSHSSGLSGSQHMSPLSQGNLLSGSGSGVVSPNVMGSSSGSGASSTASANGNATLASMRYSNTTLEECVGQIFQMCKDQYGCRYLQKKLDEDKTSVTCDLIFTEIVPEVVELMSDPFGNYLCQKLIEKCSPAQRLAIVRGVSGSLVQISKNMHGTRAVQKTIEQLGSPEEIRLIREALKGSVVALIQDLNGNHVIQKCIHRLEPNDNQFIYDAVAHHCVQVATHRHGCCVMQRCIDHSSNQQKMQLIGEIKNNALSLVQDQFGNYVVQYVLDLGMESVCESLASNLLGHLYFLSTQKFSSNVVEKCLEVGNAATVQMMSRELAEFQADPNRPLFPQTPNEDPLICLLQHPFGNYVVQTALQVAQTKAPKEWHMIAARIKPHLPSLRSNTYVKRVQGLLAQAQSHGLPGAIPTVPMASSPSPLSSSKEGTPLSASPVLVSELTVGSPVIPAAHAVQQQQQQHPVVHHHHHHQQHVQHPSAHHTGGGHHHHHHGSRSHGSNRSQGGRHHHNNKEHHSGRNNNANPANGDQRRH